MSKKKFGAKPNSKARHLQIMAAARDLIEDIDVNVEYPFLELAKQLAQETNCHLTTAKNNLAKAARQKRNPNLKTPQWGGVRSNSGRKPKQN